MSQAQLAAHAGVSRKWIYEFEAGKPNAELGLILRVIDALGLHLDLGLAERADTAATPGHPVDLDALIDETQRDAPASPWLAPASRASRMRAR